MVIAVLVALSLLLLGPSLRTEVPIYPCDEESLIENRIEPDENLYSQRSGLNRCHTSNYE